MREFQESLKTYLATRRSVANPDLLPPFPSKSDLQEILSIASRTPDHGKLVPWRFIIMSNEGRKGFAKEIEVAAQDYYTEVEKEVVDKLCAKYLREDIGIVALIFDPKESARIPLFEQQMACGAAGMNLIHASAALGFKAHWITGWIAFDDHIRNFLGVKGEEQVAGFFFIGSSEDSPKDRERPIMENIVFELN